MRYLEGGGRHSRSGGGRRRGLTVVGSGGRLRPLVSTQPAQTHTHTKKENVHSLFKIYIIHVHVYVQWNQCIAATIGE